MNHSAAVADSQGARRPAVVLTNGMYRSIHGKVAHGLIRDSDRFEVVVVVDSEHAGEDAGVLLDGAERGIPVVASLARAIELCGERLKACIVGLATHGGRLTAELKDQLRQAAAAGLDLINGLHEFAGDDPFIREAAAKAGVTIYDLRRPKPFHELHFWQGTVLGLTVPRVAVLGMDCAIGKRTTTRLLLRACQEAGIHTEMIYTGQTGWMQGAQFGFILDSTLNDFVAGELEHALLACQQIAKPDLMLIEGQSSLRNPCGPCGAELLVSGQAKGTILQIAPHREFFEGYEELGLRLPAVDDEIRLIETYGSKVLAVTVNAVGGRLDRETMQHLREQIHVPVLDPLSRDLDRLVSLLRDFCEGAAS